jgi:dienelactone hydrolase
VTQGRDELYDAEAALDFLLARPEVDPDRIGAMGFSMGGATALRVAAVRPKIRGVGRDGGFSNLGELLAPAENDSAVIRIHKRTILWLYRLRSGIDPWAVSPIDDLDAIAPRPVLLIYGEYEAAAGLEQAQASGENVQLWIVPGGAHGRNHLAAPDAYPQRVLDFFNAALP